MTISLNGEKLDARGASDIAELVERFELVPQTVLIEHNGVALHRRDWAEAKLEAEDRVEFIRVVAGG